MFSEDLKVFLENINLNKVLKVENISKSFGNKIALKDVNAEFEPGKVYAIIGPNGAGKTTLLNIINGFMIPDKGKIFIKGKDMTNEPAYKIARMGLGRLFQDIRSFNKMKVLDNLLISKNFEKEENPLLVLAKSTINKQKETVFTKEAKNYLENFAILQKEKSYAEDLSYGQEKLLSFCRLLMNNYDIFLLDEPVAGVHPKIKEIIYKRIKDLISQNKLVIIVEHEMEAVRKVVDLVYFISEGEIKKSGKPDEVLQDESIIKDYIGIQSIKESRLQKKEIVSSAEKKNILSAKSIYAGYNKIEILHGVDIEVNEGEIVGFIGPNGAGKSTLLKVLAGLLPTRAVWNEEKKKIVFGEIFFDDNDITNSSPRKRVESGLSYLIQGGEVFTDLTVDENMTVSALNMEKDDIENQKQLLYKLFLDLADKKSSRAGLLSGGERQMLALAMILMRKPRTLLLLDEPLSGLSPKLTQDLLQKIREIRNKFNISILIVEQRIGEVLTLANRIYIMKGGEIIVPGVPPYEIDEKEIETIYLGNHNGTFKQNT